MWAQAVEFLEQAERMPGIFPPHRIGTDAGGLGPPVDVFEDEPRVRIVIVVALPAPADGSR
jgi:hypothetical protein